MSIDLKFTAESFFKYYIFNPSEVPEEDNYLGWSLTIISFIFTACIVPIVAGIACRNWVKVKPRFMSQEATREWKIFNRIFNKGLLRYKCERSNYEDLSTDEKLIAAECYCLGMAGFNHNTQRASEILGSITNEEENEEEIEQIRSKLDFIEQNIQPRVTDVDSKYKLFDSFIEEGDVSKIINTFELYKIFEFIPRQPINAVIFLKKFEEFPELNKVSRMIFRRSVNCVFNSFINLCPSRQTIKDFNHFLLKYHRRTFLVYRRNEAETVYFNNYSEVTIRNYLSGYDSI